MTTQELKDYAVKRYDEGYDVCIECYSEAQWDALAQMGTDAALDTMARAARNWLVSLSNCEPETF